MRILLVRAGALGDSLMVTPVIRALAERYPEATVDVLAAESAAAVFELHPFVDQVLTLRHRNLPFAVSPEKRRLARELRSRGYDFAVLLERAPRYRELLERAGVGEIRSFRENPFDPEAHAIANNLRAAGAEGSHDMEIMLSADDDAAADRLLAGLSSPVVGLHVGYGPRGKKRDQSHRLKGWATSNFAALARSLEADGISVVVTGTSEDAADVAAVTRGGLAVDVSGRTSVRELGALIRKLDVYVSVDSGPAHLAAAVATPLVVLWGPAILEQVRPISSRSPVTVLRHSVPCAPCYDTPLMKTCRQNVCMEGIPPSDVRDAVRASLAGS